MDSSKIDQNYQKNFIKLKSQQLLSIDASRKSSIDSRIRNLIEKINQSNGYFTTSSCSGRFLAYCHDEKNSKKNCNWLKVTHDPLQENDIEEFVAIIEKSKSTYKQINLKFEPFILHICCKSIYHARQLMKKSIESGLRNSGISLGSNKIIVAIRSTLNLECPLNTESNEIEISEYVRFICRISNEKFSENFYRIKKFEENIQDLICESIDSKSEIEETEQTKNKPKTKIEKKSSEKKVSSNENVVDDLPNVFETLFT